MQTKKLSEKINKDEIIIDYAMRYGNPSIKKIKLSPKTWLQKYYNIASLPQYAAATTATVCDEVYRSLMRMRWQPSLQIIPHYESEPLYIDGLKKFRKKDF